MSIAAVGQLPDAKVNADGFFLKGIVRDSVTAEALPRASIVALPSDRRVVGDTRGIFGIALQATDTAIRVSSVGYRPIVLPVKRNSYNLVVAYLSPSSTELEELVVSKGKYSKKNNPAVDFVKKLRKQSDIGDPYGHDYYSYDKYERITLALNDFDPNADNIILRSYPFLKEYVDTSEVSGKPILNVSVKEKASTINYRREPKSLKTTVNGFTSTGIDEVSSSDNTQVYLEEVLREINIYDKDITLLQNRFVSPLSPIAPDFYKFYLTDTVMVAADSCAVLSFYPFNRSAFGFTGHVYVSLTDSAMTVRKVEMSVPKEINLNFVEEIYLTQTYDTSEDGTRIKTRDDLTLELAPLPGLPSLYVRRNTSYDSHSFDEPADNSIFETAARLTEVDSMNCRTEEFWEEARITPLSRQESRVGEMLGRFGTSKLFYYGVRVVGAFVQGYVPLGNKFDYGPVNTTVSFNAIEGTRFRVGGMTTADLSRRWFARGYVAYGLRDHKWKYRGEVEYSFLDKKQHAREFPIHSLRLSQMYDIDYVGQHYLFTNSDNVFLSLKRMTDRNVIYHRVTDLTYTLELHNNFSVEARVQNERREATQWIPFVDGYGKSYGHFNENSLTVTLRYAPGEKFYQSRSKRSPVNLDAPIFTLRQTFAPQWFSKYPINKTELSVQKRIWFSAFGYLDATVGAARVWSKSCFLDLIIPNANLSYTIQRESFALLNPMEFINDSQVSWFLHYSPNGLLFNLIPGLKKAKLREAFSFSGFYGRLSNKNVPDLNPSLIAYPPMATISRMSHGPYMEAAVGIDNIFRCLRVDYVWRLSYRHPGYNIDRSGIRIAFHATF
ncbi:MAG: DUF5686 and carboxypeptidase regulatory-like domain-containing protein [Muribaculaceae bacterium]|nr:DUF5686 and carboxypeptidase regulatory-like domain-containing protein [Muribaculaceae bacterium]